MTTDRPHLDLLADLDAGLLDAERARRVRAAARADPTAGAALDALAATRAELAALPPVPVPPAVAARWAAALHAAAGGAPPENASVEATRPDGGRIHRARIPRPVPGRPDGPGPHGPSNGRRTERPHPHRRRALRPAAAAAVLLLAVLAAAVLRAQPDLAPLPSVTGVELAAAGRAAFGVRDTGELADPTRRVGCLRVVAPPGVAPDAPLIGGRRVLLDGRPAVLLVLGSGRRGDFDVDIVAVDPTCSADGGELLLSERVER